MAKSRLAEETALAARLHRPGLRDPKLLVGLFLIALSIIAVVGVVRFMNKTEIVYVAARDIRIGDQLGVADLKPVEMRLGESRNLYLLDLDSLEGERTAVDNIQSGELVSKNDLASVDGEGRREVTVVLDTAVASGYRAGDRVDIWVSHRAETGTGYADPASIADGAEISYITAEESLIGGTGKSAVHLFVSEDSLAPVLAAVNNEDKINLVPTSYANRER